MFDEIKKAQKAKDRLAAKAYATILTNYGGLNVELHGDRAPKTVYNFVQLAKQGYYDDVKFHRLIPGFMVGPTRCHNRGLAADRSDPGRRSFRDGQGRKVGLGRAFQRRARRERRFQTRRERCTRKLACLVFGLLEL